MSLLFIFSLILVVNFGNGQIACGDTKSSSLGAGGSHGYYFSLDVGISYKELTFSTCNTQIDTVLAIYHTTSTGGVGSLIDVCDDCGSCPNTYQENWVIDPNNFGLVPGETYIIGIFFYSSSASGTYYLDLSCNINTVSPTNVPSNLPSNLPSVLPTINTYSPTKRPSNLPTELPTYLPTNIPSKSPTIITQAPTVFVGEPYISLIPYNTSQLLVVNGGPFQLDENNMVINSNLKYTPSYFFKYKQGLNGIQLNNGIQIFKQNLQSYDSRETYEYFTIEVPTLKFYKTGIYKLTLYSFYINYEVRAHNWLPNNVPHTCLECPVVREYQFNGEGNITSESCTVQDTCNDAGLNSCSPIYTSVLFIISDTDKYYTITDRKLEEQGCPIIISDKNFDIKISFISEI